MIVAVPAPTPVITPSLDTVATLSSLLVYVVLPLLDVVYSIVDSVPIATSGVFEELIVKSEISP